MEKEGKLFNANIEVVDLQNPDQLTIALLNEAYDFKLNIGEYKYQHRFPSDVECIIEYAKYFDNKVYKSTNATNKCKNYEMNDPKIQSFLKQWIPPPVYVILLTLLCSYDNV
jgi:hypothetical protein